MQTIKCVVVGDEKIGKTSMLNTYTHNNYLGDNISTSIADIFSSTIEVGERQIKLSLWDTAEHKNCDRLCPLAYPDTDVILICFSVVNFESFQNVELKWLPEVRRYCPKVKIILVGTKIDMRNDESAMIISNEYPVTYWQGIQMAKKIDAHQYLECSALTRTGLREVFDTVVKLVLFPFKSEHRLSGVKRIQCESQADDLDSSPVKSQKSEDH